MPEQIPQEMPEEEPEESAAAGGGFLSPVNFVMLVLAGLIDLIGLLILFFGLDDFGILDFLGLFLIGPLMFLSSGSISGTKGAQEIKKKIFKKMGLSFLVEAFPIVGSLSPSWTIAVFLHIKNS
jgi:hypothetical protein